MTEAEWLASEDPNPMLAGLRGKASPRKLRLFACGCCRHVAWDFLADERSRDAVAVAEQFADGLAGDAEMETARRLAGEAMSAQTYGTKTYHAASAAEAATRTDWSAEVLAGHAAFGAYASGEPKLVGMERRARAVRDRQKAARVEVQADKAKGAALLRCLFGNPFRTVALSPAWRTPDVLSLAQAAYDNRALPAGTLEPARLALLADALEDAGCDSADLLGHLRGEGPHVRGCRGVDLVLGKA